MKNQFKIIVLIFLSIVLAVPCFAESRVRNLGEASGYQWSPDGKYLSMLKGDRMYLYDVTGDSLFTVGQVSTQRYAWLSASQLVFFTVTDPVLPKDSSYQGTLTYRSLDLGRDSLTLDSTDARSYRSIIRPLFRSDRTGSPYLLLTDRSTPTRVVVSQVQRAKGTQSPYIGVESHYPVLKYGREQYYPDTDVWLIDASGNNRKRVTFGKEYAFPSLSPDGSKITVKDLRGHLLVLDTAGHVLGDIPSVGDGSCWDYQSQTIFFGRTVESEWDIVGGDLFRYSLLDNTETQVTFSPDRPELSPSLSPDGNLLVYTVYEPKTKSAEILILGGGK